VDVTLQLGPVVKGTALRDVSPSVYDFSKFRDQIEFAKLGRALNDKAVSALPSSGSLQGKTVSFVGATALRSATEKPLVVAAVLEVTP
jgi:predicted lipoprotein